VTRRSRSKRPRWEPEIETFPGEDVKVETDSDNDLVAQTTVKFEIPSTNKRGFKVLKRRRKSKGHCLKNSGKLILDFTGTMLC
jgi:hypothetical protein